MTDAPSLEAAVLALGDALSTLRVEVATGTRARKRLQARQKAKTGMLAPRPTGEIGARPQRAPAARATGEIPRTSKAPGADKDHDTGWVPAFLLADPDAPCPPPERP